MTDSALRHLRDALVLTQAAVTELHGDERPSVYAPAPLAEWYLTRAIRDIEEQDRD